MQFFRLNFLHGLSDYLDPGFNCHKIAGFSTAYDVERILGVVQSASPINALESLVTEYRTENIRSRIPVILTEINHFFDRVSPGISDISDLSYQRILQLRISKVVKSIQKRLKR